MNVNRISIIEIFIINLALHLDFYACDTFELMSLSSIILDLFQIDYQF